MTYGEANRDCWGAIHDKKESNYVRWITQSIALQHHHWKTRQSKREKEISIYVGLYIYTWLRQVDFYQEGFERFIEKDSCLGDKEKIVGSSDLFGNVALRLDTQLTHDNLDIASGTSANHVQTAWCISYRCIIPMYHTVYHTMYHTMYLPSVSLLTLIERFWLHFAEQPRFEKAGCLSVWSALYFLL